MAEVSFARLPSDECHWTLLMISQHWFRYWLGAVRQQAITWANVDSDPWRHMTSLGHNELIYCNLNKMAHILPMTNSDPPSFAFWFKFPYSFSLRVQLKLSQHHFLHQLSVLFIISMYFIYVTMNLINLLSWKASSGHGLILKRQQAITWTNDDHSIISNHTSFKLSMPSLVDCQWGKHRDLRKHVSDLDPGEVLEVEPATSSSLDSSSFSSSGSGLPSRSISSTISNTGSGSEREKKMD